MAKHSLPPVGLAKFPDFSFDSDPLKRERIRKIIEEYYEKKHIAPVNLTIFFHEIERAIRFTLFTQGLKKYSRAEVRKEIESLRGATTISELYDKVPLPLRSWLATKEISIHNVVTQHDISDVVRKLIRRAEDELTGKGRDKDIIPTTLAAEIALALRKINIKPVASRPTYPEQSSVYHKIVCECFCIVGLPHQDPYEVMKIALTKMSIVTMSTTS